VTEPRGQALAEAIRLAIEYDPAPPFAAAHAQLGGVA
jgi:hypothetical protein